MYTSFSMKNFRGFQDLELNDLARVNLIAGKNNVGKTALLEAFYLHARAYNPQEALNLNRVRGLEFELASDASLIFHMRDTSQSIVLEGDEQETRKRSIILRVVQEADELAQLNIRISANGHSDALGSLSEDMQVLALDYSKEANEQYGTAYLVRSPQGEVSVKGALPPPVKVVFIPSQGRSSSEDLARRFSNLEIANQQGLLFDALRILQPGLKRISVLYLGDKPALWAGFENSLMPLSLHGDGLNRLFNLVTAFHESRGGIVLIDEIENGLHHSVLTDIWKAIATAAREFNVQIFATTHSLEMIRAAHEAFKDQEPYDFRLHRLDRSPKTGEIYATTYNEESMEAVVNLNAEVRG